MRPFLITTFICSISLATKFGPITLVEKVRMADTIVIAKVTSLSCLDSNNKPVEIGAKCTGPGKDNKLTYKIAVTNTLFQSTKEALKDIDFAFTSKAHLPVPGDNYASQIGQSHIFYLRKNAENAFEPIHQAFYMDEIGMKKSVQKLIKKKK